MTWKNENKFLQTVSALFFISPVPLERYVFMGDSGAGPTSIV
jgi:hypothetical protein